MKKTILLILLSGLAGSGLVAQAQPAAAPAGNNSTNALSGANPPGPALATMPPTAAEASKAQAEAQPAPAMPLPSAEATAPPPCPRSATCPPTTRRRVLLRPLPRSRRIPTPCV